ncbi:MAG: UDP-N-acetylmuramoyl-L-alanine--D-glutamate ligase [Rhodoferax sp.]
MNHATPPSQSLAEAALPSPLAGQAVLVLGLGVSGLAMARWCARQGARVTVADTRAQAPQGAALRAALPDVEVLHTAFDASLVEGSAFRAVFVSPGLAPQASAELRAAAQAMGLWVGNELGLFAQALQHLQQDRQYQPQILAITGTNGKTTVTALTGHLIARTGRSVALAGNIGPTLLETLMQALDAAALPEVWVLELSSFQLELPHALQATAATVLNITQDHLDWHASMEHYVQAKARIFGAQTLMLLNRDEPSVMALLPAPAKGRTPRAWLAFGTDMPQRPGDFGLEEVHGMVWLVRAMEADETLKRRKSLDQPELHIQRLMPADALRIRGRHNASNALAALALATAAGCALGPMLFGLREYRGEPHRVQALAIVDGVEYFDDSKGTNVGATVAALKGLGQERRLVVILGGEGKGQDFSPLADPLARHARAAVLIGRDAALIRQALAASAVPLIDAASMAEAVALARAQAQPGDAVLMSPACASFDMFDNYEHRARVFGSAVQALALEAGQALEGLA